MIVAMGFGTAQVRPGTDRVELGPGEELTVGLGATATDPAELDGAAGFVWTNYNAPDPRQFRAEPMTPVEPEDQHQAAWRVTLPPAQRGTYVATAFVELGGVRHWAPDHGAPRPHDLGNRLVFRVRDPEVASLYVRQVPIDKANARSDSTDISTIDDMLRPDGGFYTLDKLAADGVGCVWLQVPYRLDLWDGLAAVDDAGSDYASTDWFAIDPELSEQARAVPAWDLDRQRTVANDAMRRLVHRAHELGMKVLFEIAPNHVGHNFVFRDHFPDGDVRRRDYSQVAVDDGQLGQVRQRLEGPVDESIKNYAEWMLPQMYAGRFPDGHYNPFGAADVRETYSPDWYGTWPDVKHLNHGGHPGERIWHARTQQNARVLAYIGRAMAWAATDLGADGFRIDHALGMPYEFFEQTLPWVEMKVREARGPGASLLIVPEDHDRKDYSARVGDVIQSKGYEQLLDAFTHQNVEGIFSWVGNPFLTEEFTGTGNHDEVRGAEFFAGDLLAYGNAVITMHLLGGPMTMLAGDEYAESQKLRFKARGGIPTLWQFRQNTLPGANTQLAFWIARGGLLRTRHPALRGTRRARLQWREVARPDRLLAFSRSGDDPTAVPLLCFSNLDRQDWLTGTAELGEQARAWLDREPDAHIQVRDLLGLDPERLLWRRPEPAKTLLETGLGVGLQPYQIQVLELLRVS
ncbi:alpha-amylase family glycosyl hydrolase [Symbioplanes lichenis]|uniref:alpha-amylase family glycosyl hydrolase n=2 Tax=Micromonosporaceae TaxID=28056 RepID=UPI002739B74A|nr:alpha-amylase family glycosyl hydrolase [Actinoplanes lichenis]